MGSFLSGIFSGSNPTNTGDQNQAGGIAGFGTSVGEGDVGAASDFDQTLMQGNPAQTAKLLAPQIGAITGQGQQQKDTIAQFGNRSGGNNSESQTIDDKTRGNIDNMISSLTGGAAANAGNLGVQEQGVGLQANQLQDEESQQALQNEQNSVFGKGIADLGQTGLNAAEGFMGL
jgi:hypothetical protein